MFWKIALGLVFASSLQGASLRLYNETICPLKAAIYSADGSFLGEVSVLPGKEASWSDGTGPVRQDKVLSQGPARSMTPFSVQWSCLDGEDFSSCEGVSTGSLVLSNQGIGKKHCKREKK